MYSLVMFSNEGKEFKLVHSAYFSLFYGLTQNSWTMFTLTFWLIQILSWRDRLNRDSDEVKLWLNYIKLLLKLELGSDCLDLYLMIFMDCMLFFASIYNFQRIRCSPWEWIWNNLYKNWEWRNRAEDEKCLNGPSISALKSLLYHVKGDFKLEKIREVQCLNLEKIHILKVYILKNID